MLNADTQIDPTRFSGALAEQALSKSSGFPDIESFKLDLNEFIFGATKEVLSTVPVGKPKKSDFFRIHASEDFMMATMTYEDKDERKHFLISPEMVPELVGEATPTLLLTTITRQNVVGLWAVKLGSSDWAYSAQQAAELAKTRWVRMAADMSLGAYRIYEAQGELSEPDWPKKTFKELVEIAFRGRVIDRDDHPVINRLRGRV